MAMEQPIQNKRRQKRDSDDNHSEREGRGNARYTPRLLGKAYFQRKKGCPFSGPKAPKIDYKDVRLLQKYVSEYGKILPRHLTGVSAAKQRELATAIKRARMLALMPFSGRAEYARPAPRGPRPEGGGYRGRPAQAAETQQTEE